MREREHHLRHHRRTAGVRTTPEPEPAPFLSLFLQLSLSSISLVISLFLCRCSRMPSPPWWPAV
ncbi:hypothetical protein Hanom_Chr08g00708721 [Helianthus anomalus]